MKSKLGEHAKQEIIESIRPLTSSREIARCARDLATHFGVGIDRIYAITKGVRPSRKPRSDRGKRAVDIRTDQNLQLVAGWVDLYDIKTSDAVMMARERGIDVPIEFTTLNRYLREAGLDKRSRRNLRTPHVRFEAKAPGEMFQFDISGLKERWFDTKNRRILSVSTLDISQNHPNTKPTRVRVWRFSLIDDYSRRVYVRYVAVDKPNSSHVVDFLLHAYAELGVPKVLYTDNDAVIKFGRNKRATEILGKALADRGGYEVWFHLPGNSRATGKVERLHSTIEGDERFIGLYLAERGNLSIDVLNDRFAVAVANRINNRVHSSTGETPMNRWRAGYAVVRTLDYSQLRSAFMADEFSLKLRDDLTIRFNKKSYQLPTNDLYPFADWIGQKLRVVFPDDQNYFTVVGLDGVEYDVPKELASPVAAGEFRSVRQTEAQELRKSIRAVAKADAAENKKSVSAPIPFFDMDFAATEPEGVLSFPDTKPTIAVEPEHIAAIAPGRVAANHNPALNFWEAVDRFRSRFADKSECKRFMDTIYASHDEECWLLLSEIESAVESRHIERPRLIAISN